jgi:type II restriction enzyme
MMGYKIDFKFDDLKKIYLEYKKKFKSNTYKYVSKILEDAKKFHKKAFFNSEDVKNAIKKGKNVDHEQSWRAFKGKNFEKLIQYIIENQVKSLNLKIINGNILERSKNLCEELSKVKRNLAIDYGEFGLHLPDVDIVIYNPKTYDVIAVISAKVTLRERIAQTGYWKLKLKQDKVTEDIKVYFITPDEDGTLTHKKPIKKGRAIVEVDLDGSYILTEERIEEDNKVKTFDKFIKDLKKIIK